MVLVERPASRVHRQVVFPCLRNHHQDGVRQRATTEVQQLENFVETRRVAAGGGANREEPLKITGDEVTGEHGLARSHPVAVALDRVDLAVVRDVAEGMCKRPAREGVSREA